VLDGVMDVRSRDVDREADLVVRQLLDLGAHAAIQPNGSKAAACGNSGRRRQGRFVRPEAPRTP